MIKSKRNKEITLKPQKENGYVYIATNTAYESKHIYKIGFSTNVAKRMRQLTGLYKMYPVMIFKFQNSREMEKKLHTDYNDFRIKKNKEYFYLSDELLRKIKSDYYTFLYADPDFVEKEYKDESDKIWEGYLNEL